MTSRIINVLYYFYQNFIQKFLILSSKPYLSGDSFKKISDHVFDDTNNLKIKDIKQNDILFVKTEYIEKFFKEYLPNIKTHFILLSHNSSLVVEENFLKNLKNKNFKWFASNLNVSTLKDKRIEVLPFGIKNKNNLMGGRINSFIFDIPHHDRKKNRVYSSFNTLKNKDRINVLRISKESKVVDSKNYANHKNYIRNLSTYKFNICPPGKGLDTHRFWESLIVKTIPVVKSSDFIENLRRLSIPMLVLEDWEELCYISEDNLSNLYEKYLPQLNEGDYVKLKFWIDMINQSKI